MITVEAGDVIDTIDTGLIPLGSLGNRMFLDENSDGIQDPDDHQRARSRSGERTDVAPRTRPREAVLLIAHTPVHSP